MVATSLTDVSAKAYLKEKYIFSFTVNTATIKSLEANNGGTKCISVREKL